MEDGKGRIKFATKDNTGKFYWKDKIEASPVMDYPKCFIGTMTPSIFRWTDMRHMYDIMMIAMSDTDNKPIIVCGKDEYTAVEFLQSIRESRMWIFP